MGRSAVKAAFPNARKTCSTNICVFNAKCIGKRRRRFSEHFLRRNAKPWHVCRSLDLFGVPGARLFLPSGGSIRSPSRLLCVREQRFDSGVAHGSSHVGSGELGFRIGEPSRCSVLTGIRCRCWKSTPRCSYCVGFGFCCAENLHWKMCSISGIGCFFTLCPISPRFPICVHRFCWE